MKIASVAEVKSKFSAYIKASEKGPVVVTRNGRPAAILLAVTDEAEIERLTLAYSPAFQKILQTARQLIREKGGISNDDFWSELEQSYEKKEEGE